jgi:hypothetical protein
VVDNPSSKQESLNPNLRTPPPPPKKGVIKALEENVLINFGVRLLGLKTRNHKDKEIEMALVLLKEC